MRLLLLLALFACERAEQKQPTPAPPRPPEQVDEQAIDAGETEDADVVADTHFRILYAARTDNALDNSNTTYFSIVEDHALFVVADAPNPDDSRALAETMTALVGSECNVPDVTAQMNCVTSRATAQVPRPVSWAAVAVRDNHALLASAGRASILVSDGTNVSRLGSPLARSIDLRRGYTIMIIDQPSLDAIGIDRVRRAMPATETDTQTLEAALVQLATDTESARAKHATSVVMIHLVRP